jgi:hypothetical protein
MNGSIVWRVMSILVEQYRIQRHPLASRSQTISFTNHEQRQAEPALELPQSTTTQMDQSDDRDGSERRRDEILH